MLQNGIIEKVEYSDWAAEVVPVVKQDEEELVYLGYVINSQGIIPSPEKLQALLEAPVAKSVAELTAFLCLINYYGHFLKNLLADTTIV